MIRIFKSLHRTIKIAVLGNCQARPIAQLLAAYRHDINIICTGVVHLLKDEEKNIYWGHFCEADYIFAQRVDDNYPCAFVRTSELRAAFGKKVIVWPNIFYRGYNPELVYLRLANHRPLRGPLGDYHIQPFIEGWIKGLSIEDTLKIYYDSAYNEACYGEVPKKSLLELKTREKDCDILISDYLEEQLWRRRLFFTFNHPKVELLLRTIELFFKHIDLKSQYAKNRIENEPLGQFEPPLNPWICSKYNLANSNPQVWRGVEAKNIEKDLVTFGNYKEFSDEEIIQTFFNIYNANKDIMFDILKCNNFIKENNSLLNTNIPSITSNEINTLIKLAKKALWSPASYRGKLQEHGVNITPANFYSNIPLISEIKSAFEYRHENQEIYNYGLFNKEKIAAFINTILVYAKDFSPPVEGSLDKPETFFWKNPAFSYSDAMAYYCILRHYKPSHVLEIGSGFSTLVANQALSDNGFGKLTLIEPYPKDFLKDLNRVDKLIVSKVQDIPEQQLLSLVSSADIWFIDSTHTVKIGSDCLYIYLKIMPKINKDIVIHSHDVYLPFAYPENLAIEKHIYWTEQYLLYAYMLDNPKIEVLFSSAYAKFALSETLDNLMCGKYPGGGGSIWYKCNGSKNKYIKTG